MAQSFVGGGLMSPFGLMIEDTEVTGDNLILQDGSVRNIDAVAVIGDDDDGALNNRKIYNVFDFKIKAKQSINTHQSVLKGTMSVCFISIQLL